MSAHCHHCGADMVYAAEWPAMECPVCKVRNEGDELRDVLRELHRAVDEHDGTDADEARLEDALASARRLAPYTPEPVTEGF